MFSATWPTAVQKLAANFLCSPIKVTIGSQDLAASHSITQVSTRLACGAAQAQAPRIMTLSGVMYNQRLGILSVWPPVLCYVLCHLQVVEVIDARARDDRLLELLKKYHSSRTNRVIIFVLYKKEAPRVEQLLTRKGWKVGIVL